MSYTLSARALDAFRQIENGMATYDPKNFDPNNPATFPTTSNTGGSTRDMVLRLPDGTVIEAEPGNKDDIRAARETAVHLMREQKKLGIAAPLPAPVLPAAAAFDPQLKPIRLSQAVDEYLLGLAVNSPKTGPLYRRSLVHFQEWLKRSTFEDKDPYVHEIGTDHVKKWKLVLKAEAEVRAQKKRDRRKHEQEKIAADPELAKVPLDLKLRTAGNLLGSLNTFLAAMQELHHYPQSVKLPTQGQNFVSKSQRMKQEGWLQFNPTELAAIFKSENYATLTKPHEYWFPLLALLTGARREEIAQLTVDDIRHENGFWIIDINDRDFRRVKSAAGVRIIPLHPMLIELGILDYIQTVKAATPKVRRIFPYLRYDKSNGFGDVPGEAFARYLDRLGITEDGKVLHSLRKNANDRLRTNDVDEARRCRMIGHVYESVNATVYASKVTVTELQEKVLPQLAFPELEIARLKRPVAEMHMALSAEVEAAEKRRTQAKAKAEREARKSDKTAGNR